MATPSRRSRRCSDSAISADGVTMIAPWPTALRHTSNTMANLSVPGGVTNTVGALMFSAPTTRVASASASCDGGTAASRPAAGSARTGCGGVAKRSTWALRPPHRHATQLHNSTTVAGGPSPRILAIGRRVTPGAGCTSTAKTHAPTRRPWRLIRTSLPTCTSWAPGRDPGTT